MAGWATRRLSDRGLECPTKAPTGDFMKNRPKSERENSIPPWELLLGASEESQRAREAWRAGRPLNEIGAKVRTSEKSARQQPTSAPESAREPDVKPSTISADRAEYEKLRSLAAQIEWEELEKGFAAQKAAKLNKPAQKPDLLPFYLPAMIVRWVFVAFFPALSLILTFGQGFNLFNAILTGPGSLVMAAVIAHEVFSSHVYDEEDDKRILAFAGLIALVAAFGMRSGFYAHIPV